MSLLSLWLWLNYGNILELFRITWLSSLWAPLKPLHLQVDFILSHISFNGSASLSVGNEKGRPIFAMNENGNS